jgi:secreted trypsin-like serine protease
MKVKLVSLLAAVGVAACASAALASSAAPRADTLPLIRGGTAVHQGELPALVFIAYLIPDGDEAVACTGTVIAPRLVLTAAHCVDIAKVRVEAENFRVSVGAVTWTRATLSRESVVGFETDPGYDPGRGTDDAALLELETPVAVPPLQLARRLFWSAGTEAEMAGWGKTSPEQRKQPTYVLHRAPTTVLGFAACRQETALVGQLCAEQPPPRQRTSACYGDSGGPLLAHRPGDGRVVEIGIVHGGESFGCNPRYASTYTSSVAIHGWVQAAKARLLGP